jgi:hypothetical protein
MIAVACAQLNRCSLNLSKLQPSSSLKWVLLLLLLQGIRSGLAQPTHLRNLRPSTSARSLLAVSPQPPAPPATYQLSVQLQWNFALATPASTVPSSQVDQVLNELATLSGGWLVDYSASLSASPPSPPSPSPPWPPPGELLVGSYCGNNHAQAHLRSGCCKPHAEKVAAFTTGAHSAADSATWQLQDVLWCRFQSGNGGQLRQKNTSCSAVQLKQSSTQPQGTLGQQQKFILAVQQRMQATNTAA